MSRVTGPVLAAVAAVVIAVPAAGAEEPPHRAKPTALESSSLTWCGDVERISAPAEAYRDSPVYVSNEQPVRRIRDWARTQPGYQDLWVDREHLGWLTLAFTQDAEARQADLVERFPNVGVVAVEVQHTNQELRRLQDALMGTIRPLVDGFSIGVDVTANLVSLGVPVVTEELVATVEESHAGQPFCIDGLDPSEVPAPGPQPLEGDGWNMVAFAEGSGPSYRTGVAADADGLARLWQRAGLEGDPPIVDFGEQVAVWFALGHGSSCPELHLVDVIVDVEAAIVYPEITLPGTPMGCTDDLTGAWQFIVLLDRDRLPEGPFTVQLGPTPVARDRTTVEADLSRPSAIAPPDAIHAGPHANRDPERSGLVMEPMGPRRYAMDISCGIGYLGEVNSVHWVTQRDELPEAWLDAVDGDEVVVQVRLRVRPEPRIIASAGGESVVYRPSPAGPPPCDG